MNALTERFAAKYPTLSKLDLQDIDRRTDRVAPEHHDRFYNLYLDTYEYPPSPARIMKLLNENPEFKVADHIGGKAKRTSWNGIQLYSDKFADGELCLLCLEPKDRSNGLIVEYNATGYHYTQICACSGGNPRLKYLVEWKEYCRHSGLIDYNTFCADRHWKNRHKRDFRDWERAKLKTME